MVKELEKEMKEMNKEVCSMIESSQKEVTKQSGVILEMSKLVTKLQKSVDAIGAPESRYERSKTEVRRKPNSSKTSEVLNIVENKTSPRKRRLNQQTLKRTVTMGDSKLRKPSEL